MDKHLWIVHKEAQSRGIVCESPLKILNPIQTQGFVSIVFVLFFPQEHYEMQIKALGPILPS